MMKCICEKKDREMDKKQKEKDERYEVESVICIREAMVYRATPFLVVSNSFSPPIPFIFDPFL